MAKNKRRKQRGRGEGSISQRPGGRWEAKITVGTDNNGRRIRRAVYGDTKEEVQDKLAELRREARAGLLTQPTQITVGEFLVEWLATTVKPKSSPTTYNRYESIVRLKITPIIGGLKVSTLVPMHVYHLMGELQRKGESLWSQKLAGMYLHTALKTAVRLKLLASNPAAEVPRAKPGEREMSIYSEEQVRVLITASRDRRLGALFVLAVSSGMRQGELLALEWTDFDFDAGTVSVKRSLVEVKKKDSGQRFITKEPKSRASRRTIKLSPFVVETMRRHQAAMLAEGNVASHVFCTKGGEYVQKSNMMRQIYLPMLKKAGLPRVRFHDLRHTHVSLLLAAGESIKAISRRLGHGGIEITLKTYAHLLPDADNALAERLQKMFG